LPAAQAHVAVVQGGRVYEWTHENRLREENGTKPLKRVEAVEEERYEEERVQRDAVEGELRPP